MLLRAAALASLAGGLFGYDLGLIGGALSGMRSAFAIESEAAVEAIVGAAKLGAFFGAFAGGAVMLRSGRRIAVAAAGVLFAVGPLMMAFAGGVGCVVFFASFAFAIGQRRGSKTL
jgi:MFS family permease